MGLYWGATQLPFVVVAAGVYGRRDHYILAIALDFDAWGQVYIGLALVGEDEMRTTAPRLGLDNSLRELAVLVGHRVEELLTSAAGVYVEGHYTGRLSASQPDIAIGGGFPPGSYLGRVGGSVEASMRGCWYLVPRLDREYRPSEGGVFECVFYHYIVSLFL